MKSLYIKDLQKNQLLDGVEFIIFECNNSEDKNGRTYCSLMIGDKTGKIAAKIWSEKLMTIDSTLLKKESIVKVFGKVDEFKGNLQLTITKVEKCGSTTMEDFVESSTFDADEMMFTLKKEINTITNKHIREILLKILSDPIVEQRYKYWPAAETVHHDFRSGLLQHVLEMIEIAKGLLPYYPEANFDVLRAGIILHDIGKIYELDGGGITTNYTKEGMLIGHIVKGAILFDRYSEENLPEDIYLNIIHLILSHHGSLEYGSPVVPSTVEAVMLTYIDNLSSKARTAVKAKKGILQGENFSPRNYFLSNVRVWNGGELTSSTDEDLPRKKDNAINDIDDSEKEDEGMDQLIISF